MIPADEGMAGVVGRLEAATGPDRLLDALIHQAINPDQPFMTDGGSLRPPVREATFAPLSTINLEGWERPEWMADGILAAPYTASIDTAMTLIEGGPDAWRRLTHQSMSVYSANPYSATAQKRFDGTGATPAIQLCVAALRARFAKEIEAEERAAREKPHG